MFDSVLIMKKMKAKMFVSVSKYEVHKSESPTSNLFLL